MNCPEVRRHLGLYLDSECDAEIALALCEHIARCETCARRVAEEQQLEAWMAESLGRSRPADASMWASLLENVTQQRARRRWPLVAALAAAGVLLALTLALALGPFVRSGPADAPVSSAVDLIHSVRADHAETLERLASRLGAPLAAPLAWSGACALLAGRIPFTLSLHEDVAESLVLLEARACHLGDEPVALLAGTAEGQPFSLFLMPARSLGAFPDVERDFAGRGEAFTCRGGGPPIGLARHGGTLACVIGPLADEALLSIAVHAAGGFETSP